MTTCTPQQFQACLESFTLPNPNHRSLIQNGRVGLIELPPQQFQYSRHLGYAFEVAVVAEDEQARRLLFVRIDSWDPEQRQRDGPPDYCIPGAYEGASSREKLKRTIPFGGGWSDSREEALLVFQPDWAEWFGSLKEGLAFSNPGADSAAFLKFGPREVKAISAFCRHRRPWWRFC
jgi:hypothetical protein